jgi:hypothetical protein
MGEYAGCCWFAKCMESGSIKLKFWVIKNLVLSLESFSENLDLFMLFESVQCIQTGVENFCQPFNFAESLKGFGTQVSPDKLKNETIQFSDKKSKQRMSYERRPTSFQWGA